MPMTVLAEAIVRIAEGSMSAQQLSDLLAHQQGSLTAEDLPKPAEPQS
jgi:hypothetical protein